MTHTSRYCLSFVIISAMLVGSSALAQDAQRLPTEIGQTRFDNGQNIVPVFEGWIPNPDGTFDLVFGYMNRNYVEELAIPAGPNNNIEPGGPDRGQATYFLTRRRARLFRVRVPKDFGKQELVWTVTVNGKIEKAYASLLPVEEINEQIYATGNNTVRDADPNRPPAVVLPKEMTASVGAALPLSASVTDDGLPKPPAPPRQAVTTQNGNVVRQVNNNAVARPRGLAVTWFQLRGPAKVTFDRTGPISVANGKADVPARFPAPGIYTLVATANDGALSTKAEVTVTVTAASSGRGR